jgi:hypothetical protein
MPRGRPRKEKVARSFGRSVGKSIDRTQDAFGKFKLAIGLAGKKPDTAQVLITNAANNPEVAPEVLRFCGELLASTKDAQWKGARLKVFGAGLSFCREGALKEQGRYYAAEGSLLLGEISEAKELFETIIGAADVNIVTLARERLDALEK